VNILAITVPLLKKEFVGGLTSRYLTRNKLRKPCNLSREYLCVELLHKQAMYIYGVLTIIGQALTVQFVSYCNYTLLRNWNELEMVMKVLIIMMTIDMTLFWGVTLEVSGRFYVNSTRALESWRLLRLDSAEEIVFMEKFKKRCKPLAHGLEGYRKITRLSILEFIGCIARITIRALLALEMEWKCIKCILKFKKYLLYLCFF